MCDIPQSEAVPTNHSLQDNSSSELATGLRCKRTCTRQHAGTHKSAGLYSSQPMGCAARPLAPFALRPGPCCLAWTGILRSCTATLLRFRSPCLDACMACDLSQWTSHNGPVEPFWPRFLETQEHAGRYLAAAECASILTHQHERILWYP
jgi:hypothetical protein